MFALSAAALLSVTAVAASAEDAESDTLELDTVTILGTAEALDRVSGSAHRIGEETLERNQHDDINRILSQVPGVYVREEEGYGLRPNIGLRGGSSDRSQKVTLMEDGVLIAPAPYAAPAAYYFPLTTRMTAVEVFKGPSAIQYGPQTIGGAINLVSAPIPAQTSATLNVAGGSDAYRRVHARGGGDFGGFGLSAEAVHLASDGFKDLDGGGDTGFDKNEVVLKASRDIGPGNLRLRLGHADELSNETYLGLTDADFAATPNRRYAASAEGRFDWDWQGARLDWSQPALGGNLNLVGYWQQFDRAWRKFNNFRSADIRAVLANPDDAFNRVLYETLTGERDSDPSNDDDDLLIGTNARAFISNGVQGELDWELGRGGQAVHLLEVGLRVHSDRVRRDHDEFAFEIFNGDLQRKDSSRAITADNTGFAQAVAAWVRDEILLGRWTLVPGLRVESISVKFTDRLNQVSSRDDYTQVLPGLGASYAWSNQLTLIGGVHQGFSPATPGPQAEVEPEEALNWEAGVRWRSANWGRLESVAFYSDYSNLTSVCTFSAGCGNAVLDQQINAGSVDISGIESGWNHEPNIGKGWSLPLSLAYTFTETEFQETFSSANPQFGDVQAGFELPYVPEHRANARIGLTAATWSVNLSATYQSQMRDVAGRGPIPDGQDTDEFTVFDMAATWDATPALRVQAQVNNLLDEHYIVSRRPFGARPGLPLTAQIGLTYSFQR